MWILNNHAARGMRACSLAKAVQPGEILAVVGLACLDLKIDIDSQANILPMAWAMEQFVSDIVRCYAVLDACQRIIERALDTRCAVLSAVVAKQRSQP